MSPNGLLQSAVVARIRPSPATLGIVLVNFNRLTAQCLEYIGYTVVRSHRYPQANLNLLELGCLLVSSIKSERLKIVQIGAFDGEFHDPLSSVFLNHQDAAALLVEPQPQAFERLRDRFAGRHDVLLENVAIANRDGTAPLYLPLETECSPLASLDRNHLSRFGLGSDSIGTRSVRTLTMKSLLTKHRFHDIDILQIDTEGQDYNILKQVFDLSITPLVVNLESAHLSKYERLKLRSELSERGYQYVDADVDTFAVRLKEIVRR